MLKEKMKEHDGSYRCHMRKNKTRDMTDRIVPSMLEDETKERNGPYRCYLRQNKMRDMTGRIGVVYARRQNKRTWRIV